MCAQVLLPAAGTDEKALLARLERLEKGTPSTVPQSPRRPPQPAPHDEAERARAPSPAARPGAQPPEQPRAASPPARPAPEPREPARAASPRRPARHRARAAARRRRRPRAAPGPACPRPTRCGRAGAAILEAVKRSAGWRGCCSATRACSPSRTAVLTLRFPRDGDMQAFSVSGHDAVLKRVLSADFGLNVTIKGVAGADVDRQGGRPGRPEPESRRRPARPRSGGIPPPRRRRPLRRNSRGRSSRAAGSPVRRAGRHAARRQPRGRAVTGRPGGPERRADRHGPHPARAGRSGDRRIRRLSPARAERLNRAGVVVGSA